MEDIIKNIEELPQGLQCAIRDDIANRIMQQVYNVQENAPEELDGYLQKEIQSAISCMNRMVQESALPGAELFNISKVYVFNKERLKALREFQQSLKAKSATANIADEKAKDERNINVEKLREYFNLPFKGVGHDNIDYFTNNLLPDLRQNRSDKDFAKIALMIYGSGKLVSGMRPNTFKEWYRIFCELVGCGFHEYKPNALIPNDIFKKAFYYLQR